MRVAAARELFEEAGIWLGAPLPDAEAKRRALMAGEVSFDELASEAPIDFEQLVWTSHWITPVGVPKRFDTYFFLATVDRHAEATIDDYEAVDLVWIKPAEAITKLEIVFPTLKNLEALAGFTSAGELLASREGAVIKAVQPIMI